MGIMFDIHKDYLGDISLNPKPGTIRRLLKIGAEIRTKLGAQGFLFDRYFSLILDAADTISKQTMEDGFDSITDIYGLIDAVNGDEAKGEYAKSPFYPRAKEYMDTHPLTYYKNGTKRAFYFLALCEEYAAFLLDEYLEEQAQRQHGAIDTLNMDERYKTLCELTSAPLMEEFVQQINLVFGIVSISKAFLQGMLNYSIYVMTEVEEETGRYVLLSMMDKLIDGMEI